MHRAPAPVLVRQLGKRLVKAPKLYFVDVGLACYLLGITAAAMLDRSPFLGPVFECFVASEIAKHQQGSRVIPTDRTRAPRTGDR